MERWAIAAGLIVAVLLVYVLLDDQRRHHGEEDKLRALADQVAKDPETASWAVTARRAVAEGTAGRPWGVAELRDRLAGLSAATS